MKTSSSPILRSILGLGLSVFFLVACHERERNRSGDTTTDTTTASDTTTDTGVVLVSGCAEDALAACEYPSRGVEFD